ncbi:hypothetical protein [Vibrio sp. Hal054]|uniref:hypothetical protein n=1 Tax=Vibrio sp. Hal054 TaxID=3035158 RepID=UPI00301D5C36
MFEKVMKFYAVNATVIVDDRRKVFIDTNAADALDRIQQVYDFRLNMADENCGYNLDNGMIFTNGHHYVAYEMYPGPEAGSVLVLTSRCSDLNLDDETSKAWVAKGILKARKQKDKILNKIPH